MGPSMVNRMRAKETGDGEMTNAMVGFILLPLKEVERDTRMLCMSAGEEILLLIAKI